MTAVSELTSRTIKKDVAFVRSADGAEAVNTTVRRLLSRFISQGFQSGLSRVTVIEGPGAQPRLVLMGRLAVYGAGAARLPRCAVRSAQRTRPAAPGRAVRQRAFWR